MEKIHITKAIEDLEDSSKEADTTKYKEFQKLFAWLLDSDSFPDLSSTFSEVLAPNHNDPNIYYPEFISKIIDSRVFQRLNHISQLGLAVEIYPNSFQTRAEHSLGVYENKLEEIYYQSQDPIWRKYIENNNLKPYLLARLIKNLLHDCGHFPYSHAFENLIIGKHGFHEDVTARLILEDTELTTIYNEQNPEIFNYLKAILERKPYKGLTQELLDNDTLLEEGSIDTDRREFLNSDLMHYGFINYHPTLPFKAVRVAKDENTGELVKGKDGRILEDSSSKHFIYAYDYSDLLEILNILSSRNFQYQHIYVCNALTQFEENLGIFFKTFLKDTSPQNEDVGKDLREYLSTFKHCNGDASAIDLEAFKSFDEVKFYLNLLDIFEHHSNPDFRAITLLMIPSFNNFMSLIYHFLYAKITSQDLSKEELHKKLSNDEKALLEKISKILKEEKNKKICKELSSSEIKQQYLRELNRTQTEPLSPNVKKAIQSLNQKGLLGKSYIPIKSYKPSKEPIYITDSNGDIFELLDHPDISNSGFSHPDFLSGIETVRNTLVFVNIPFLRLMDVDEETISTIENSFDKMKYPSPIRPYNCHPINLSHFSVTTNPKNKLFPPQRKNSQGENSQVENSQGENSQCER